MAASVVFVSCGDDEVEPNSPGKNAEQNTTDVAVTGSVSEVGALWAQINGVVNLEVITASYTNVTIGVEVSTTEDFKEKKRTKASDVVGRKFSVRVTPLSTETRFYYRTYVSVSSLSYDYYGETYSFTTSKLPSDFIVTGEVEKLGYVYGYSTALIKGSAELDEIKSAGATAMVGTEVSENADFTGSQRLSSQNYESFSHSFTSLAFDTKYYYRAYCRVALFPEEQEFYGKTLTFTTLVIGDNSGTLDGHDYVDLYLPSGTLWATMNVGASKPEDYGSYFAWGETSTKSDYSLSTYTYSSDPRELPTSADAAYVSWGSNWRMPSQEQFGELINSRYTTTTWTTLNGVKGRLITSKTNGNSIFLPAAGYRVATSLSNAGSYGYYWSRTLYTSTTSDAYYLYFGSSSVHTGSSYRYGGLSVRPVRLPEQ